MVSSVPAVVLVSETFSFVVDSVDVSEELIVNLSTLAAAYWNLKNVVLEAPPTWMAEVVIESPARV